MLAIDHAVVHLVAELVAQRLQDHVEGAALVVRQQVLCVFEQERGGALRGDDARDVENSVPGSCIRSRAAGQARFSC